MPYFIRLKSNNFLKKLIESHLARPSGSLPKSGIEAKFIDLSYQAGSWEKPRRVVCRIAWHENELFHRIGFVVTNSRISVEKVIKLYNRRAEIEKRIKEGKNTSRWDKTSCRSFESNEARLKMGLLACNLLNLLSKFYIRDEGVRRSVEWLIRRLFKVVARISYHARRWQVQVLSALSIETSLSCSGRLWMTNPQEGCESISGKFCRYSLPGSTGKVWDDDFFLSIVANGSNSSVMA